MIEISSSSGSFTALWKYHDFTTLVKAVKYSTLQAPCRADGGGGGVLGYDVRLVRQDFRAPPLCLRLPVPE